MLSPFTFTELHSWYLQNGRSALPWRDYSFDEKTLWYRVWLAETMLQQTQVDRVKQYFENILAAFPAVEDLAACSYDDFFPYYKWLGYYSRARNMLAAAQQVVDKFNWVFPRDTESLRTLKWVWPYTAEAIKAFAYNESTLSFDTNLEKIFSRYYHGNKFQKLTKEEKSQILQDFQKSWILGRDINNALMDYGATVSLNNISWINWDSYPLPSSKFYQTRWELEPVKEKKKSTFPNKQAYVIAVLHENHKMYFSENQATPSQNLTLTLSSEEREQAVIQQLKDSSLPDKDKIEWAFTPFLIGKNSWNPRSQIQEYFSTKYWLELSVRPPEVKSYNSREVPYMVCYCQIQSGKHNFVAHEWIKVRGFEEWYVEEMEFWENLSLF